MYIVSAQHYCDFITPTTIFQSATALGKLGHPDGELNLTRAAGKHGVIQMVMHQCYPDLEITDRQCKDPNACVLLIR